MSWLTYSPATHRQFADAIQQTYVNSLDCPALNGLRDIEDVIAGHQATGDFDPNLWRLLRRDEQPAGVTLLGGVANTDALEVVYLGLAPGFRGQGLGDLLMQQAMHDVVVGCQRRRLTLAVDSRNQPALRLYFRHGMRRLMSRIAMIRDLRRDA